MTFHHEIPESFSGESGGDFEGIHILEIAKMALLRMKIGKLFMLTKVGELTPFFEKRVTKAIDSNRDSKNLVSKWNRI